MSALVVSAALLAGTAGPSFTAGTAHASTSAARPAHLLTIVHFLPQQHGIQSWSQEEWDAVEKDKRKEKLTDAEKKLVASATNKDRFNQKHAGTRNVQKRAGNHRNPPKKPKAKKRR